MIKFRYWLLAILSAMSIHVFAFGMYTIQYSNPVQLTLDVEMVGIEMDISMLDATTMEKQQAAATAEPLTKIDELAAVTEVHERNTDLLEIEQQPNKNEAVKPLQQTDIKKAVNTAPISDQSDPRPSIADTFSATAKPAEQMASNSEKQMENTHIAEKGEGVESGSLSGQADSALQQAAQQTYFNLLARKLAKHKHYPNISRRRGEQGVVQLFFVVSRDGKIKQSRIETSSGYQRLDQAVIEMLEKAQPLPVFPDEMLQHQLEVNVPIAFELSS